MANNRIFYACQAVAIAPCPDSSNFIEVHGVQSVGLNTTFNLEQIFELGQIQIYENIEGLPDVEVTLEKVLDGYPLMYRLATKKPDASSPGDTLVERTKNKCCVALGIWPDDKNTVSGEAPVEVYMSGMYVNSISYTFPTDGNCTESVTLVGNHKAWNPSSQKFTADLTYPTTWNIDNNGDFPYNNQDGTESGGVQRRENVVMQSSIIPLSIFRSYGLNSVILASGNNWDSTLKTPKVHIQNVTMSTDLGREPILELGRKLPYYRAPNFPVEVTCEIEVISISGDFVNAYEEGDPDYIGTAAEGNNTQEETISIRLQDGSTFDLGHKNRLSSVTFGGGDAGGGNATMTFSFSTFNDFTVFPPHNGDGEDPA